MAAEAKVSVALTPEMNATIREAVEGGDYASTGEVVREALREWKQRRLQRQQDIDALRALWQEGIESRPGRLGSIDAIKAEARRQRNRGTGRR
jgi:antitoxin ParD1/3/4